MRSEPSVDAAHMESMAALRQDTDLLADGELRQADGAVFGEFSGVLLLRVRHLWERLQDLLLKAFVRRCRSSATYAGESPEPGAPSHSDESEHAY